MDPATAGLQLAVVIMKYLCIREDNRFFREHKKLHDRLHKAMRRDPGNDDNGNGVIDPDEGDYCDGDIDIVREDIADFMVRFTAYTETMLARKDVQDD